MIPDTSLQDQVVHKPAPQKMKWLVIALVLITLLGSATWVFSQWAESTLAINADRLRIATVERGDLTRDVSATGQIVAGVSPVLYSPAKGTVSFSIRAGDQVKQGDILAQIDSPELQNQLRQEQAKLRRLDVEVQRQKIQNKKNSLLAKKLIDEANVILKAARREYERNQLAWDKGVINEVEYLAAKDELETAKITHQYNIDEAKLNLSTWQFEQQTRELELEQQSLLVSEIKRLVDGLSIRAPINGMVGNLVVVEKSLVEPNAPLLSVVDLSQLEIEAQVPEIYADNLSLGLPAMVRIGSKDVPAILTSVSPEITSGQISTRIRFADDLPQGLRQNQRLQIRILLEQHQNTLLLTKGPFMEDSGGRIAYVIEGDYAVRKIIKSGASSVSHIQVLEGLQANDQVVISRYDTFKNAEQVRLR